MSQWHSPGLLSQYGDSVEGRRCSLNFSVRGGFPLEAENPNFRIWEMVDIRRNTPPTVFKLRPCGFFIVFSKQLATKCFSSIFDFRLSFRKIRIKKKLKFGRCFRSNSNYSKTKSKIKNRRKTFCSQLYWEYNRKISWL